MLYIHKNSDNVILTDSVIDYIPSTLDISLDDDFIGTYANESIYKNYFLVTIPANDIKNITNAEHQIKFGYYGEIKRELCMVKDSNALEPVISETKTNKKIVYEKQ